MNKTKYTFLVPSYKASFFEEALESIKNQTFTDFKVLVSDDCSPESLESIYNKVCGEDSRFNYRRNEENMGSKSLVSHWNLLVDMCDTEYLIMASDDDVYEPKFLEEIDGLVRKYPDVDILRAKAVRLENGRVVLSDGDIPEYQSHAEFMQYFGVKKMVLCLANYVFKTDALRRIGGFPDFPKAASSDGAAAMLLSRNGIATTRTRLFTFRISDENLSCANSYVKHTEQLVIGNLMFVDWYKEQFGTLYPYENYAVGIEQFHLPRLSFFKMLKYFVKFYQRGYMHKLCPNLTILKNWFKLRINSSKSK